MGVRVKLQTESRTGGASDVPPTAAPRCASCRFWNRNGEPYSYTGNEAQNYEQMPTTKQKCLNVLHANNGHYDNVAAHQRPALVTDGSGYAASFWTAPEFGCTSFEAAT